MKRERTASGGEAHLRDPATALHVHDRRQISTNGNAREEIRGDVEGANGSVQPGTAAPAALAAATQEGTMRGQGADSGMGGVLRENSRREGRWGCGEEGFGVTTAVVAAAVLFAASVCTVAFRFEHEHVRAGRHVRPEGGMFFDAVNDYDRHGDGGHRVLSRRRLDGREARWLSQADASAASDDAVRNGEEESQSLRIPRSQVGAQQSRA